MLAGRIRLKTFLTGTGAVGLVFIAAAGAWSFYAYGQFEDRYEEAQLEAEKRAAEEARRPQAAVPQVAPAPRVKPFFDRDVDSIGVTYLGRNLGSPKEEDVTAGKPYKINVYQDEGKSSVNRLKVDLDRDDKWDESWTFTDAGITRKIAPNDDEDYTREDRWDGRRWVPAGKERVTAPEPAPSGAAPEGLDPVQTLAMGYKGQHIGAVKLKDVTKGKPYKINVYQDAGNATVNRVKLDLDRDDQWDESWTFAGETITRKVSPNDDGNQSETYHWDGTAWGK